MPLEPKVLLSDAIRGTHAAAKAVAESASKAAAANPPAEPPVQPGATVPKVPPAAGTNGG